jgi:hypothetical protein
MDYIEQRIRRLEMELEQKLINIKHRQNTLDGMPPSQQKELKNG